MSTNVTVKNIKNLPLWGIAALIREDWTKPYFGAVPYIDAMGAVEDLSSPYGADNGEYIVAYFLGNANTWRGPVAREVKAELKRRLGR